MTKAKTSAGDSTSRRKFLSGAAVAAAATVAAPSVVKAQGPISMRWQSTWPSKDIFHEYALRLRQEGQRHDRRRPQDRGAAGRRGGAGLRPARRGVQGHARRRPRRARLPLRQADRAGAVGLGPGLRHGRQHAAGLAQVRRRQGAARRSSTPRSAPTSCRSPTARCRRSRSAGSRSRSPRSTTSRASSSAPSASRSTCSPGMGAAVNALPGGEIVPAMDRGLLDAAEFNNASSDRVARLPRRVQGLHAAELPPERRAVRDHVQQGQVRRAAGQDEGDHRQRRRGGVGRTCRGRRSTATRRTTSSCRPRTRSSSTRRRTRSCRRSSRSTTRSSKKKSAENPLFKEIVESQNAFAERATRWEQDTVVNRRMAFNHYFGANAAAKKI